MSNTNELAYTASETNFSCLPLRAADRDVRKAFPLDPLQKNTSTTATTKQMPAA